MTTPDGPRVRWSSIPPRGRSPVISWFAGGLHQVAYARALENLTGSDLMKLFPTPRIPTDKIPESKVHIDRGEHLKLYRFSQDAYNEVGAVWNGSHPETRRGTGGRGGAASGGSARPRPPAAAGRVRAGLRTEEIVEIAAKLRAQAGLPKQPTGEVSDESADLVGTLQQSAKRKSSRAKKAKTKSGARARSKK